MDIALAIHLLVPSAQYGGSVTENTKEAFDVITWEDKRQQPTWEQIMAAHEKLVPAFQIRQRMSDLDGIYSRTEEDRDAASGFVPHVKSPAYAARQEKIELRQKLKELGV